MNRYTAYDRNGNASLAFDENDNSVTIEECIKKLAQYEDTGLDPEQVALIAADRVAPIDPDMLKYRIGQPVFVVCHPDADGERLTFWALVGTEEDTGAITLSNNLGGISTYEEEAGKIEALYDHEVEA